jgi:hypothetical protein
VGQQELIINSISNPNRDSWQVHCLPRTEIAATDYPDHIMFSGHGNLVNNRSTSDLNILIGLACSGIEVAFAKMWMELTKRTMQHGIHH